MSGFVDLNRGGTHQLRTVLSKNKIVPAIKDAAQIQNLRFLRMGLVRGACAVKSMFGAPWRASGSTSVCRQKQRVWRAFGFVVRLSGSTSTALNRLRTFLTKMQVSMQRTNVPDCQTSKQYARVADSDGPNDIISLQQQDLTFSVAVMGCALSHYAAASGHLSKTSGRRIWLKICRAVFRMSSRGLLDLGAAGGAGAGTASKRGPIGKAELESTSSGLHTSHRCGEK